MRTLFPESRIARADRDEIQNRESLELLIHKMENKDLDIFFATKNDCNLLDKKSIDELIDCHKLFSCYSRESDEAVERAIVKVWPRRDQIR